MTFKERMIHTLTGLLKDGEILLHPIYGIFHQANEQYYGYFGLTHDHLLVALINGKQLIYTERIPLHVESVSVKNTRVFKQAVIDISFADRAPCRITASQKVLTIDSQIENLPQFLQVLESRAPKAPSVNLRDVDGERIRWQYCNVPIFLMLAFFPMPLVMFLVMGLKEQPADLSRFLEAVPIAVMIWGAFLLPFVILSLFNRTLFGKIVCVVNGDGLYLKNTFIPWSDVQAIAYHPEISSRSKLRYTYATVYVKPSGKAEYALDILHFPLYGLRKIKKYHPTVELSMGKNGFFTILLIGLAPTVVSVIIPLLG